MTTQVESDQNITVDAFATSLHLMPFGVQRTAWVADHLVLAMGTTDEGLHSGRRRYLVACVTCEKLLHEATTGPGQQVTRHIATTPRPARTPPVKGPPVAVIKAAMMAAKMSECAKSKRGAVVFRRSDELIIGRGNNMPMGECDGSDACRRDCNKRCVHAEGRVLRNIPLEGDRKDWDLVHVKLGPVLDGTLVPWIVPGGGPSCWQCSREIFDAGLAGVWLYEYDQTHPASAAASGKGAWRYYTAKEFHEATLKACGIHPYPRIATAVVASLGAPGLPTDCRMCNGTGTIDTGNNDLPCVCQAGDLALFNTERGTETGAQIKARRR